MIVVSTNGTAASSPTQRAVARVLDGYANTFALAHGALHLRAPSSTAAGVQGVLGGQRTAAFFFFGHGAIPPQAGFIADDGNLAIHPGNVGLLQGRSVGGTCCHGDRVGAFASSSKFSMFGYAGKLMVPLLARHIADMEPAVLAGPHALVASRGFSQAVAAATATYQAVAQRLHQRNRPGDRFAATAIGSNATLVSSWP
jgi:hypothetical protein